MDSRRSANTQPEDPCCSGCKSLLNISIRPHSQGRGNTKTLNDLVDSANTCNICALLCTKIGFELFGFNLENLSSALLGGSSVEIHCYNRRQTPAMGRFLWEKSISASIMLGSKVSLLLQQRHGFHMLSVSFDAVWPGSHFLAFDRGYWKNQTPVALPARIQTVSRWLSQCKEVHPKCNTGIQLPPIRPARFIEITREENRTRIRLVKTDGMTDQHAQYIALSHCWGGVEPHCRTTLDKLVNEDGLEKADGYYSSIPFDLFPQTSKDAVEITRSLGVQYLWIDCMCIIQAGDAGKDWRRESGKMASIFQKAILTISATTARNCHHGLGVKDPLRPALHQWINLGDDRPVHFAIRHAVDHKADSALTLSSVHERAWIFQEKILSNRILHVTHGQMIWQCCTDIESEDGQKGTGDQVRPSGDGRQARDFATTYGKTTSQSWLTLDSHLPAMAGTPEHLCLRRLWWDWVLDYCGRKLTKSEDNYAALAGAVKLYQQISGDTPVVGLWKRDLPVHLGWHIKAMKFAGESTTPTDPLPTECSKQIFEATTRAPSWTWMSFPHWKHTQPHGKYTVVPPLVPWQIWGPSFNYGGKDLDFAYLAHIPSRKIHIQWGSKDKVLIQKPVACSIKIRSLFSQVHAPKPPDLDDWKLEDIELRETAFDNTWTARTSHQDPRDFGAHQELWNMNLDPDITSTEFDAEDFDIVLLYVYKDEDIDRTERGSRAAPGWNCVHLVLKRIKDDEEVYRRIGLLHRYLDFKMSKDEVLSRLGKEKEITLV